MASGKTFANRSIGKYIDPLKVFPLCESFFGYIYTMFFFGKVIFILLKYMNMSDRQQLEEISNLDQYVVIDSNVISNVKVIAQKPIKQ